MDSEPTADRLRRPLRRAAPRPGWARPARPAQWMQRMQWPPAQEVRAPRPRESRVRCTRPPASGLPATSTVYRLGPHSPRAQCWAQTRLVVDWSSAAPPRRPEDCRRPGHAGLRSPAPNALAMPDGSTRCCRGPSDSRLRTIRFRRPMPATAGWPPRRRCPGRWPTRQPVRCIWMLPLRTWPPSLALLVTNVTRN